MAVYTRLSFRRLYMGRQFYKGLIRTLTYVLDDNFYILCNFVYNCIKHKAESTCFLPYVLLLIEITCPTARQQTSSWPRREGCA